MSYPRGYPHLYPEILKLVRRKVLHTMMARRIIRKSGFRPTPVSSPEGEAREVEVLSVPPVVYADGGSVSEPI